MPVDCSPPMEPISRLPLIHYRERVVVRIYVYRAAMSTMLLIMSNNDDAIRLVYWIISQR